MAKKKMYCSTDCYNLEKIQEEDKEVKAKDVFDNYTPPKKVKNNKDKQTKNKKKKSVSKKGKK